MHTTTMQFMSPGTNQEDTYTAVVRKERCMGNMNTIEHSRKIGRPALTSHRAGARSCSKAGIAPRTSGIPSVANKRVVHGKKMSLQRMDAYEIVDLARRLFTSGVPENIVLAVCRCRQLISVLQLFTGVSKVVLLHLGVCRRMIIRGAVLGVTHVDQWDMSHKIKASIEFTSSDR